MANDRPLRFCMVTTFYPPYSFGGDGAYIHRLSNALAARGHQVEVIHCYDAFHSLQKAEPARKVTNHPNVTVHTLRSAAGILSPLLTQQLGSPWFKKEKIRRILDQGAFDVIHFHNISLVGGPGVLELGRAVKLYTMHEYWLVCPTHVLFKSNREACQKEECLRCTIDYRRPPQFWRWTGLIERAVRHVDMFIASSRFVAERHRRLNIPLTCIPLFVPAPKNVPAPSATSARPFFLFVGRLEKLKGLQDVIPLFEQYDRADLLIAGTGLYETELRSLAGTNPRVRFLGALPYEELASLYTQALAVIVPSLCYETFGLIVAEAFSQRTPVLVRDIGAVRELVVDTGGGFLFSSGEELVAAMERLRTEPGLRSELGHRGHDGYTQHWTEERHLERYLALVNDLLGRRAGVTGDRRGPEQVLPS